MSIPLPIEGHFALIDHEGRAVTPADFAGRFMLIFFGFTHCRVVCPRMLAKLTNVLAMLGDRAALIQPLYISVDPERDTPSVMKAFLSERYPAFLGLTGSRAAVDMAKQSFLVFAKRADDSSAPGGYTMPHTAFTYLLDVNGRYLAHFPDALTEDQLTERLSELIR